MSADVFVHAMFAIPLPKIFETRMRRLQAELAESAENDEEEETGDEQDPVWYVDRKREILQEACRELRLSEETAAAVHLLYTGDEDDHWGRCNVGPDEWYVGIGYLAFPDKISPAAAKDLQDHGAGWYSWVTG